VTVQRNHTGLYGDLKRIPAEHRKFKSGIRGLHVEHNTGLSNIFTPTACSDLTRCTRTCASIRISVTHDYGSGVQKQGNGVRRFIRRLTLVTVLTTTTTAANVCNVTITILLLLGTSPRSLTAGDRRANGGDHGTGSSPVHSR
jgi:hypothetical protein